MGGRLEMPVDSEVVVKDPQRRTTMAMARTSPDRRQAVPAVLSVRRRPTASEMTAPAGIDHSVASKPEARLEMDGKASRSAGRRIGNRRASDGRALRPATEDPLRNALKEAGSERLGRGELARLVLAQLAASADEPCGAAGIAKALGRSRGAVANALERLVATGEAVLVTTSPRRYRAAAAGRAAAAWDARRPQRADHPKGTATGRAATVTDRRGAGCRH